MNRELTHTELFDNWVTKKQMNIKEYDSLPKEYDINTVYKGFKYCPVDIHCIERIGDRYFCTYKVICVLHKDENEIHIESDIGISELLDFNPGDSLVNSMKCKNCKSYEIKNNHCRKNRPQICTEENVDTYWPIVREDSWCEEFKERI